MTARADECAEEREELEKPEDDEGARQDHHEYENAMDLFFRGCFMRVNDA